MLTQRWVNNAHRGVPVQREAYATVHLPSAINMGWYGQRNGFGSWQQRPKVIPMALEFFRKVNMDYYTADETFLTTVWIPTLQNSGHTGTIIKFPSHPFRNEHKTTPAFRKFWNAPLGAPKIVDMVLDIADQRILRLDGIQSHESISSAVMQRDLERGTFGRVIRSCFIWCGMYNPWVPQ